MIYLACNVGRIVSAQDKRCVAEAVSVLRGGGVVCLPTDTVYGLAAGAEDDDAVARIFAIKGRRPDNPLPIFISSFQEIASLCKEIPPFTEQLAQTFWPGGLTMVLPKAEGFHSLALVGNGTVAVRVPGHELVLAILRKFGRPLTGTSANISGQPSPSTAEDAIAQVGDRVDLTIDGGRSGSIESTIVDLTGDRPTILRTGAIAMAEIERVLRLKVS